MIYTPHHIKGNAHALWYNIFCQDGGAVGLVDFTKHSFAWSSLARHFDQMGSIPEYVFVILCQPAKAYVRRFRERNSREKKQIR